MSEDIVGQIKDIKGRTWQEAFYIQTKAFLEKNSEHLKEIERLKAEVERLTAFTTRTIIPNEELQAKVERLTKAGDAMAELLFIEPGYIGSPKQDAVVQWCKLTDDKPHA